MSVTVTQQLTQQTVFVTGNPVENNVVVTVSNARGPAGTGGGSNSITSATTSDGTADLLLLNVETTTAEVTGTLTAPHIHGNLAGSLYAHVRAAEDLDKGDPVYVSGSHGSGATLIAEVSKADASNAAKMPAVGIMDADVLANATGHMVISGTISDLATNTYSINAELYVDSGGGLTATPPTARAQPVARVERSNLNNGAILVKVNGLSASDATGNTLVRRTSGGDASFGALNATALDVASSRVTIGPTGVVNFGATSSLVFDTATYTYSGSAAAAHRTALGAGTTGSALFTAITPESARETALNEIIRYAPNAAAARTNPTTQAADDVLTGMNLTAGIWEISFYFSFDSGTCGVQPSFLFGTTASVGIATNNLALGPYYRGGNVVAGIPYATATGIMSMVASPAASQTDFQYVGTFMIPLTGNTTFGMRYAVASSVAGQTVTRRANAFLRARKVNG